MSLITFFIILVGILVKGCLSDETISIRISEEISTPSVVGNIIKESSNTLQNEWKTSANSSSFFILTSSPFSKDFFKMSRNGDLILTKRLDREIYCPMEPTCTNNLRINGRAKNLNKLFMVELVLEDINDVAPTFEPNTIQLNISESNVKGNAFMLPSANDPDSPKNSIQSYHLQGNDAILLLQPYTSTDRELKVTLQNNVDREIKEKYIFYLTAVDGGVPRKSGTLTIDVNILDVNDNDPQIQNCESISKDEDISVNSLITTVAAIDRDVGKNGLLKYSIRPIKATCGNCDKPDQPPQRVMEEISSNFQIDPQNGQLRNTKLLDYEKYTSVIFFITVSDSGSPIRSAECEVKLSVRDTNDNKPSITALSTSSASSIEVVENKEPGTQFGYVFVEDKDAGEAGRVSCSTSSSDFALVPAQLKSTYNLETRRSFDRENKAVYQLEIKCSDHGTPSQTSTAKVKITIGDVNDHEPKFRWTVNTATFEEGKPAGQFILDLRAADEDIGENSRISYSIDPEFRTYFDILDNGTLVSKKVLDREEKENYTFNIVAMDNGTPRKSSSTQATVILTDINDVAPSFEKNSIYYVPENASYNYLVGEVKAVDLDKGMAGEVFYTAIESKGNQVGSVFFVDRLGKIYVRGRLDRETQEKYFIHVLAQDRGTPSLNGTGTVTIVVQDINDSPPKIRWPSKLNHSIAVSFLTKPRTSVAIVDAVDEDAGENARLSYSLLQSAGLSLFDINSETGSIFIRRSLKSNEVGKYELVLRVTDNGYPRRDANATITISINDAPVQVAGLTSSEMNFLLIIIICSVTFVLSCILVASIWHTRRRLSPPASNSRYYGSSKCCQGSDELDSIDAKIPMEPQHGVQDMQLDSLESALKVSQVSLNSRGDYMLPVRYCQIHDFDTGQNHRGSTLLPPQYGLGILRNAGGINNCDSGQSSESDSGRGTCLVEDDPFKRYGPPSDPPLPMHSTVRPWGVSTFTLDRNRPETPRNNNVDTMTVRRTNHKPPNIVDGVLV